MTTSTSIGGLILLLAAAAPVPAQGADATRPNIILFLTDDQDKVSIGAYGGDTLTPNLDRLAREGMLFHNAFVSSTVCTPSRYSFLTGRYAGRSYSPMYRDACPPGTQGFPSFNVELEDDNRNVGEVLRQNGYTTGYVGKFHVGPELKSPEDYAARGLEPVAKDASPDAAATAAFQAHEKWCREYLKQRGFSWAKNVYWGNLQSPFAHHNPEWTIDAALEFLEANRDRPFYLHYCTTLQHGPDGSWRNSMDHPLVSGAGMLDKPLDVMTDRKELLRRLEAEGLDPMRGHAGYIWTDESLGAVLDKLDELGIAENTLIVFTSDHGSNMKASLFDIDGTCVPCIARWPGHIAPGTTCDALVQNIDFVPTFFDVAGAGVPADYQIDGRSLAPLFSGETPADWRESLYFELGSGRAIRTDKWKYIAVRYPREQIETIGRVAVEDLPRQMSYITRSGIGVRGAANSNFFLPDQLYQVTDDPGELHNLADNPEYAAELQAMRRRLTESLESLGRPFGEFLPGGNAVGPGLIDDQIDLVRQLKIQGKTVIVPDGLEDAPPEWPTQGKRPRDERAQRRALRQRNRDK